MAPAQSVLNAFTVDVEDYFHVQAFADRIERRQWGDYESRIVENTRQVLRLLAKHEVRATFFVLGWVADHFPDLIRELHRDGHEIGCHSYWHRPIYQLTPEEFQQDLEQANQAISNITGEPVTVFRAPSFSITKDSLWAFDILIEAGIRCDSSVFPIRHDFYGIPDAPRELHSIERACGQIWEFPPSVCRLAGYNLPVSGGGYFRLYPFALTQYALSRINRIERQPFMFYIHPWELDPDQPRLPGSMRSRFRHYQNLHSASAKLDKLLSRFSFGGIDDVLQQCWGKEERVPPAHWGSTAKAATALEPEWKK